MAEIFSTDFPGTTLPGTMSTDHRLGGSSAVAGGNLTLTTAATAESYGIARQTTPVAMPDGDTATVRFVSTTGSGVVAFSLRTDAANGAFMPSVSVNAGGNWFARVFRTSTGPGANLGTTGPSASTNPWLRFRRSGTSCVAETAPDVSGVPGAWTTLYTWLAAETGTHQWTSSFTAVQIEVAAYTFSAAVQSAVISRLGLTGGTTTDLGLRVTAGAATVDLTALPLRVGGGGSLLFESNWDNSLGNALDATFDGTKWDRTFAASATTLLTVVSAASVGANTGTLSTYTGNVLRIQQRGPSFASKPQVVDVVPASTSHWGRFYFRDDETATQHLHPICYPVGGSIQIVPWARQGTASGVQLILPYGSSSPNDRWIPRDTPGGAYATLAQATWYRYEYHIEYLTATTFRLHPRVYSASGTLLYDSANYYTAVFPGTTSLAAFHAGGGFGTITDVQTSRTFSIGTEGPGGSPDNGQYFYHAKLALSLSGWIGA